MALTAAVLAALLAAGAASAQEPPGDAGAAVPGLDRPNRSLPAEERPPPPPPPPEIVPPEPIGSTSVQRPENAPANTEVVVVSVVMTIDEHGEVTAVHVDQGAGSPWDEAVLEAATQFRFQPATVAGVPVSVDVAFVARFMPPAAPAPPPSGGPPLTAILGGHLAEKGTARPVPAATLFARFGDQTYSVVSAEDGAFELPLPEGNVTVEITVPGYKDFHQSETLHAGQKVAVRYLLERQRYNPFETIVIGQQDRVEVSRTTLRGRDLTRVPGTFGDPFRAVTALPGVGNVFSLLGYTVIRGTSPANSGFLIDGLPVPQLFHYLAGPAVLHPLLIERIDFYPGGFPVRYGGYTGGIVDGITDVTHEPPQIRWSVDLLKVGVLVKPRLADKTGLVAAVRVGYPAVLLGLIGADITAGYWDYQAQYESPDQRLYVLVFGSYDTLGADPGSTSATVTDGSNDLFAASAQFHRVDMRYRTGHGDDFELWMLSLGFEQVGANETTTVNTLSAVPRFQLERRLNADTILRAGADFGARRYGGSVTQRDIADLELNSSIVSVGAWADLPWSATSRLQLTPGLRADLILQKGASQVSADGTSTSSGESTQQLALDPRILVRYALLPPSLGATFLKGTIGLYSQPPRFPIPIPGINEVGLRPERCRNLLGIPHGCLLRSYQASVGVERDLGEGFNFDAQTYYAWMDPIFGDFIVNGTGDSGTGGDSSSPTDAPQLLGKRTGRSYGLELLLRKRDQGTFFGWVAYTLSRTERRWGNVWKPYDFDRTHMLQVVGGVQLPRNWELGGHFQYQTGRPGTGPFEPLVRLDPFWRFDVRIDKRAVYQGWLFDFYVEVINAAITPEPVSNDVQRGVPYVFPFFGLEGIIPL